MTVSEVIPKAHHGKSYVVHFVPSEKLPAASLRERKMVGIAAEPDAVTLRSLDPTKGAPAGSGSIEDVIATAVRIPSLLDGLRHDVVIASAVLGTIGVVNIAFVIAAIRRRRATIDWRDQVALPAVALPIGRSLVTTTVEVAEPPVGNREALISGGSAATAVPRCACDAPISARSRTGRCRRCARNARVQHAETPPIATPITLTIAAGTGVDEDVEVSRAVLKSSRIGKQTEYYSVVA